MTKNLFVTVLYTSTVVILVLDLCFAGEWVLTSEVYEKTKDIQTRGLSWLKRAKNKDFGWNSGDTPRAILAIAAAEDGWPREIDLSARLSAKQLEIELLEKLIRHDVEPVTPAGISLYALALSGVCKDPRNFYGHNLIASLEKHHGDQDYPGYPEAFGFSLTSFVSCLGGSHLHKRQIRHLLLISNDESTLDSIDTRSMAILALECFRRKKHNEALTKHMGEALKNLALLQQPDGSFGNIHTTAIAIQALAVADGSTDVSWNRTAGALAMASMQRVDGSFLESIHATSEAVIAATALLNGVGLLSLKRGKCLEFSERPTLPERIITESTAVNTEDTLVILPISTLSSTVVTPVETMELSNKTPPLVESKVVVLRPSPDETRTLSTNTLKMDEEGADNNSDSSSPQPGVTHSSLILSTSGNEGKESITSSSSSSSSSVSSSSSLLLSSSSALSSPSSTLPIVTVKYWLWIGPDPVVAEKSNISVAVPLNSTFFTVMRRAAELNPKYEFSASVWPNGHYVHTLSGHREQPIGYHYWLLYKLPKDPDPKIPPPTTYVTPAGVDNLHVQDGEIYLYWYKKL